MTLTVGYTIKNLNQFLKAAEYNDPYYMLAEDVRSLILLQDDIDERFMKNDYINLIACTILYHQIVERFIESLINQRKYLIGSGIQSKVTIDSSFTQKLNELERIINKYGTFFKNDRKFIKKSRNFNRLRNEAAHDAIKTDNREIINQMNQISKDYHQLQKIYQTASIDNYNIIISQRNSFVSNPKKSLFTKKNTVILEQYISNSVNDIDYINDGISDVINLYKKLYETVYDHCIEIDIDQEIDYVNHGFLCIEKLLYELKIYKKK